MQRNELIKKIEHSFELVIAIGDDRFTIVDEDDKGYSIAKWGEKDTERMFNNAEMLVSEYMINGKPLEDHAQEVKIIECTGF